MYAESLEIHARPVAFVFWSRAERVTRGNHLSPVHHSSYEQVAEFVDVRFDFSL
jgi:hypothetical protein